MNKILIGRKEFKKKNAFPEYMKTSQEKDNELNYNQIQNQLQKRQTVVQRKTSKLKEHVQEEEVHKLQFYLEL